MFQLLGDVLRMSLRFDGDSKVLFFPATKSLIGSFPFTVYGSTFEEQRGKAGERPRYWGLYLGIGIDLEDLIMNVNNSYRRCWFVFMFLPSPFFWSFLL